MIVNHHYRFIFLKTRKTAGTSLEVALSRICAEGDIVTPLNEALGGEESLRRACGGFGPSVPRKPLHQHRGLRDWRRLISQGRRRDALVQHSPAADVRRFLGSRVWDGYFKFAVERDPWERAVSHFHWRNHWRRWQGNPEFEDVGQFVRHAERRKKPWLLSNWSIYALGDEIAVDRVLRFENLAQELEELAVAGVLPRGLRLPDVRLKGDIRSRRADARDRLSAADCDIIARHCAREIAVFGYQPPHGRDQAEPVGATRRPGRGDWVSSRAGRGD